jgi:ligand-binding sensor domain-containing protein
VKYLLAYALCFTLSICFGQDNFINYTTKDGLPSNQVYDIYQDKHGIIWFATDRGLSSFNGSYFTNFTTLDGLLSDVIYDFFPQEDGTVWCSTNMNSLFILNPLELTFTPYKYNYLIPKNSENEVKSILLDNGNHYFRFIGMTGYLKITSSGKIEEHQLFPSSSMSNDYYINHLSDNFYYYSNSKSEAINSNALTRSNRDLIVGNNDHIARINYGSLEILHNDTMHKIDLIERGELLQLGKINNNFWITGYNIGTKVINKKGQVLKTYLPELPCSKLFEDDDQGIWISTLSNGIFYSPATNIKVFNTAKNEHITSISTDSGRLAFGTHLGSVIEYTLKSKKYTLKQASSRGVVGYHKGELFSNVNDQDNEVLSYYIRKISDNPNQQLLITTQSNILNIINNTLIWSMQGNCFDAEFYGNNIVISNGTSIRVIDSSSHVIKSADLNTTTIDVDIYESKIYCATSTRGLLILDKNLKIIKSIDTKSGLESNFIYEVNIRDDDIWLGTRNGITRISDLGNSNLNISTIGVSNGLSDKEVIDFDFIGDTIFLGTRSGINYFEISKWNEIINSEASIYFSIKRISQQGQELVSTENLKHNENNLAFEIELANYSLNKNTIFRYKLDGIDQDWTVTHSRRIDFKSLPPGNYQLLIQANVNDHWHEKVLSQKIIIHPAWYTTWWFIALVSTSLITIIWLFFKYRILNYNRAIIQEILRQLLKRVKKKSKNFVVRSNGKDIRIDSEKVLYIESTRNYLTIYCENQNVVIREKISDFLNIVPDPIEYIQVRRSVIVRIDKVTSKSKDSISINNIEIKLGITYIDSIKQIHL